MRRLENIFRLGVKELFSLRHDTVLLALIVWAFSLSVYTAATGMSHDLRNASIAIVERHWLRCASSASILRSTYPSTFST